MLRRVGPYAAIPLAGLLLFVVTHDYATASRGYEAIGGEAAFILLPLMWLAVIVNKKELTVYPYAALRSERQEIKEVNTLKEYSWEFDETAETWRRDTQDTIEECLAAARLAVEEGNYGTDEAPTVVYIGANIPFVPTVDAESVLDNAEEQAREFAGDVGKDWDAYDWKNHDQINELKESLSRVLNEWLEKYGYAPEFYAVHHIKQYQLDPLAEVDGQKGE